MEYLLHVLVLAAIYTILAASLDLLAGRTGLVSVAHAAFYGLGAYSAALLALHTGVPFLLSVPLGMLLAIVASLVVSLTSIRLHDDYFVIATFAFQMILFAVFNNLIGVTRGPLGISGIPRPAFFGWTIQSTFGFALLAAVLAGVAYLVVDRIANGPLGRVLLAIREDEIFASGLGKDTFKVKATVFAVSGALAASAGSLYAHYATYIDPKNFTVAESILVISMVIVGGAGSRWGPLIGAVLLVCLPEALRFVGLPNAVAANLRQILYSTFVLVAMIIRPRGLVGRYGFGR